VSLWHDVPLRAGDGVFHFIVVIPKESSAKMEVARRWRALRVAKCPLRTGLAGCDGGKFLPRCFMRTRNECTWPINKTQPNKSLLAQCTCNPNLFLPFSRTSVTPQVFSRSC
jgi:hypothetical protein